MHALNTALAVTALTVIALGLLSNVVKRSVLSEPLIALAVGVAVGPYALGWLDPRSWAHEHTILEQAARLTLAIGLMGIALRTPREDFAALWRPVTLLLAVGMLGMWLTSGLLAYALLGVAPLVALLLGAIVTPTDPIVASSIVTGPFAKEHLPDRVRSTLSLESGANDGLAYLFVLLPITLLHHAPFVEHGPGHALWRWLIDTVAVGVLLAVVIGVALGVAAGWTLRRATAGGTVGEHSFLSFSVALSLLALGLAKLAGSDGILVVFITGVALNLVVERKQQQDEENVQEAIGKLFNLPIFVLLGLALPWREWLALGWPALALAGLVVLLRRPPVVLLLFPVLRRGPLNRADVAFLGWFGPIGVAALYYAMLATKKTELEVLWPAASLIIVVSILAHGVTAAPLTRLHARALGRRRRSPPGLSASAPADR